MKVAFLGNMNNNNFALMRYFRDLGADAHLLQWSNDGLGANSHFTPENDTWDIAKWSPYIHRLDIGNSLDAVIGNPVKLKMPPSIAYLRACFDGYDALVGSGISPIILGRCGRSLDIFYPYSMGIEFVGCRINQALFNSGNLIRRLICRRLRAKQIKGIQRARFCLNADLGLTKQIFETIGKEYLPLAIPMVYHMEKAAGTPLPKHLEDIKRKLGGYGFKCFSHASQTWVHHGEYSLSEWQKQSKNNHWLIVGFSAFLKHSGKQDALLVLLEYGADVDRTKGLIRELGIEGNVVWLPKMPRKELMYVLDLCDVGVGEFIVDPGCIWGGTGWEVLASGKPMLQSFNFTREGFERDFGHPPPPVLDAKSPEDVAAHLIEMSFDREKAARIGRESRRWFDNHNGNGLARKWFELLKDGEGAGRQSAPASQDSLITA